MAQNRLTAADRERAVRLMRDENYSTRAAARELNCDPRTVRRWYERDLDEDGLHDRHGGGHPAALSAEDRQRVVDFVSNTPFVTAGQLKEELHLECPFDTIRR